MRHRGFVTAISFYFPRLLRIKAPTVLRPLSASIPCSISSVVAGRLQSTLSTPSPQAKPRAPGYNWIPNVESLDRYEPGGYHPIAIGDVLQFYKEHGDPEAVPIQPRDEGPLPPGVPEHGVKPLDLSIAARDFELTDTKIVLSDFGESYKPSDGQRLGKDCNTPGYLRPPEAHLAPETPLTYAADIWTLGLSMWDCVAMQSVFSEDGATPDEMVSQAVDVLGPLPEGWRDEWAAREAEYFGEDGKRRNPGMMLWSSLDQAYEQGCREFREARGAGVFDEQERAAFLHLMGRMLVFRPQDRISAKEILDSEWVVKWVTPDVGRSLQADESKSLEI